MKAACTLCAALCVLLSNVVVMAASGDDVAPQFQELFVGTLALLQQNEESRVISLLDKSLRGVNKASLRPNQRDALKTFLVHALQTVGRCSEALEVMEPLLFDNEDGWTKEGTEDTLEVFMNTFAQCTTALGMEESWGELASLCDDLPRERSSRFRCRKFERSERHQV